MKYYALLGVLLLVVACGSKSTPSNFVGGNTGGTFSTGVGGHGNRTGSGGGGTGGDTTIAEAGAAGEMPVEVGSLAPTVEITSPQAVTDPDKGSVLTGLSVTVTCSAIESKAPGATAVLSSSLKIQMFGANGKQLGMDGAVMSTANADEYAATFVLNGVATGAVSFTCTASDQGATVHQARDTVGTFFDGGPVIAITDPADKSPHSLGPTSFQFSVLPAPLASGDQGAAVDTVTLSVNAVPIKDFSPKAGAPGYYQGSVDLSDATMFTPTPAGPVPVIIKAINKRGTSATGAFSFIVDSIGPQIAIIFPPTTSVQFIGHQTTLVFTVVDQMGGAGIDPNSVTVKINTGAPVPYEEGNNWHLNADGKTFNYTFFADGGATVQFSDTVTISARDKAGNVAKGGSAQYYVDTTPPIIDLDPPALQEAQRSGQDYLCSEPFDPLGDSPNDLAVIDNKLKFRALLWDLGNDSGQGQVQFFSDIDNAVGVRLYLQSDRTAPLLAYTGTGPSAGAVCNDIADHTLPFIALAPVAPASASFYDSAAPINGVCTKDGTQTVPSPRLCNQTSVLSRVIQHELVSSGTVSVIYGIPPLDVLCTGGPTDLANQVTKDGWLCAAVLAQDKIGNIAVSPPLRLCLDAPDATGPGFVGKPGCALGTDPAPTCVAPSPAGCVPPPHFAPGVIRVP